MSEPKRGRGRPRKDPTRLAKWSPPEGWVRIVAWAAPEERAALKRIAAEADTSVANLIRSLASGLEAGVISPDELLHQVRKGLDVMQKIPTLFQRDSRFKVTPEVRPGCEWVLAGEGESTEKLDGTNIRVTIRSGHVVRVEKRRNPNKAQKAQGIIDGWYVDASDPEAADKWIHESVAGTDMTDWTDGEHSCEAMGPKIQGNPLSLDRHLCVPFDFAAPIYSEIPRSFAGLSESLVALESQFSPGALAEGIVFHHPDGRRAKIKRRDFGR
ncbi:MAG: hypothetical protein ACI8RZ_000979 [Myxococcota bacterium]|jgi:hypothetical protein